MQLANKDFQKMKSEKLLREKIKILQANLGEANLMNVAEFWNTSVQLKMIYLLLQNFKIIKL